MSKAIVINILLLSIIIINSFQVHQSRVNTDKLLSVVKQLEASQ